MEISLGLRHVPPRTTQKAPQTRQSQPPPRAVKSNRSRIATPSLHDPGGHKWRRERPWSEDVEQAVPSSQDLAESFLLSEPREERLELQAVIASQSQYLQESVTSTKDELGLGAPGGMSLPSFIANFFRGVGDRLQISIKDVVATVEMELSQEVTGKDSRTSNTDTVKIVVKIAELVLEGLVMQNGDMESRKAKRLVIMKSLDMLLLSDSEMFSLLSHGSAPASPRSGRSHAKQPSPETARSIGRASASIASEGTSTSPSLSFGAVKEYEDLQKSRHNREDSRKDLHDRRFNTDESLDQRIWNDQSIFEGSVNSSIYNEAFSESSSDSFPAFASAAESGLGLERSSADSLQSSSPKAVASDQTAKDTELGAGSRNLSSEIDNRGHAEMLARTGQIDNLVQTQGINNPSTEDLAQSKIFSHDQAESMYMSAVSSKISPSRSSNTMPGAWGWSEPSPSHSSGSPEPSTGNGTGALHAVVYPGDATDNTIQHSSQSHEPTGQSALSSVIEDSHRDDLADTSSFKSEEIPVSAKQLCSIESLSFRIPLSFIEPTSETRSDGSVLEGKTQIQSGSERASQLAYSQNFDVSNSLQGAELRDDGNDRLSRGSQSSKSTITDSSSALEVTITNIRAQFDVQIVKLVTMMAKEVLDVFNDTNLEKHRSTPAESKIMSSLTLRIDSTYISFREHVPVESTSLSIFGTPSGSHSIPNEPSEDLLLQLAFSGLHYGNISAGKQTRLRMSISRISLSHGTGEIVSFAHDLKMRESVKNIDSLTEEDLLAISDLEDDNTKVIVQLKPVRLKLDLARLDDVLSRSGGLSSLLDLGNSIVSTGTFRSSPRKIEHGGIRPRTVRFQPTPSVAEKTDTARLSPGKVDVRIAGAVLDLIGSESAMKLKSSAIKVIFRQEGLGVQIDRSILEGPLIPGNSDPGNINIRLNNIRVEYLPTPKEADLDRLISILTPSKDKYDDDDDIMVDTLLRQRRQGGVLRVTITELESSCLGLAYIPYLRKLSSELGKLSTVAKYLPEDDRPGILTFGLIKKLDARLIPDKAIGELRLTADLIEGAHVNVPSLMAAQIPTLTITRNNKERLLGELLSTSDVSPVMQPPMIMCRFIADEMEPTIKLKFFNACVEYRVSTLVSFLGLNALEPSNHGSYEDRTSRYCASPTSSSSSSGNESTSSLARRAKIAVALRDSAIGLNPTGLSSKALVLLTDASLSSSLEDKKENLATIHIKKASLMVTDNTDNLDTALSNADQRLYFDENDHVQQLTKIGFVPVSYISSASATLKLSESQSDTEQLVDVELRNNLLIIETCADSTQTLISILNSLSPPSPPSKLSKYRTEIVPIEDLLASFTGNAYVTEPGPEAGRLMPSVPEVDDEDPEPQDLEYVSEFYPPEPQDENDELAESYVESEMADSTILASASVAPVTISESITASSHEEAMAHSLLDFREDYFVPQSAVGGTAHRWNSNQNTYGLPNEKKLQGSPLRVRVRDVHIIWNLFDGYDWQSTRDTISQAVKDIETRASAKRPRSNSRLSPGVEDDEESVIGDFLFNSIYIGIPANKDPRELASAINHDIDDLASDTGSYATTTTITGSPARHQQGPRVRQKKLRLARSKHHKMAFELNGISADFLLFPAGSGEVESSLDIRVKNLEVFDHVPTSTWKKFATYMQDAGEREADTNMVHLEILNVKPIADLAASEMILKITVLPLRLHVDQDALDFICRFFEFKDEKAPAPSAPSTPPFLQRVEVNPIKVKLDFKPKRVDYGGLRSGRTTEFMNFFVLDRADMVLRRVILYGVSGFDRVGIMLNNIWSPDVRRNQLPGVLAGLADILSIFDVGSGIKDLVVVPMREYKKDGRIVRSIQKGALAFAKTTTKELVNLGAKLAIGTQTVLQDAESLLKPGSGEPHTWESEEDADEDSAKKQISLYADQPIGVVQGLRGAYASLERDLLLARDAIVAVPGEVMASGSATGAAKAVLKQTPTIILRPAIGATKAVGQTLLGAGNTLDRDHYRRMEEVSFSPPLFSRLIYTLEVWLLGSS